MNHSIPARARFTDVLIRDFSAPAFQAAFRQYFSELGIHVSDWDGLFREMNADKNNAAFLRTAEDGSIVGFLQFIPIDFTSWFFEERCGLIREFWITEALRRQGHGEALLRMTEAHFVSEGIRTAILTTDTAERFYLKHGYFPAPACRAKNNDPVFVKRL